MINSEPYNKFINTKDGVNGDSYFVYLKQDNLYMLEHMLGFNADYINSWSSKNHDQKSWEKIIEEAKDRISFGKSNKLK